MDSKQALRRTAQSKRAADPPSHEYGHLLGPLIASATRVASYVPLESEPGLPPQPGWLLPVVLPDGDLDWALYDDGVGPAGFGLTEPVGPRLGVEAISTCDLVITPALLVDRQGTRLGKGRGCYDRALARCSGFTVAVLCDGELVDTLPAEPHDVPVRAVVTPALGVVTLPAKM
ncbi:MAG: 5-formyltetrahydrofolate cyclo-ligase [Frankiales bacterium]|nr:5-formyltetrahydrofolate cyclo-ligase [Frankiales bacterium]